MASLPTSPTVAHPLGLMALLAITACGPDRAPSSDRDTGRPTPGEWSAGEGWTVGPATLEIGELAGADAYHFVNVVAATRQQNGVLVVADAGSRRVRRYDAEGRYLDDLGAAGEGPGEFRDPAQIILSHGDQITIWDAGHWRLSHFDPRGMHLGDDGVGLAGFMRVAAPPLYPASARRLGSGEWVVSLDAKPGPGGKGAPPPSPESLVVAPDGGVARTPPELDGSPLLWRLGGEEQVVVDAPWGPQPIVPPLARRPRLAVQPGGDWFCVGDQRAPLVRCSGPGGAERNISWDTGPIPLGRTEREVARWRESTEAVYGQKISRDELRRLLDQVPIPSVRPPYSEIHLDTEGHLWVKRGPDPDGDSVDYLVFDPSGRLLGHVGLPDVRVLEIGADVIVAIRTDSLGVQYVQTLPIAKPE